MVHRWVFLLAISGTGGAGETPPCKPPAPDARIRLAFLPADDLATVAAWSKRVLCVDYRFDASLSGRRIAQAVKLEIRGRDASTAVELLLHPMNLAAEGSGADRRIVAAGPEAPESRAIAAKEEDRRGNAQDRAKFLAAVSTAINKVDEAHYIITREVIDLVLSEGARLARFVPEQKGGKLVGVRLFSVKPDSLLAQLGLRNGDVLEKVNGLPVGEPDAALEAYAKAKDAPKLRFAIARNGVEQALEWEIIGAPLMRIQVR